MHTDRFTLCESHKGQAVMSSNASQAADWDLTRLKIKDETMLVLVSALCWHLLYILTRVKLSSWLRRLLYPSGVPDDPEAHQKANKTVAAAAVLVVSMICIAVVVPMALVALLDPHLQSDPILACSQLSVALLTLNAGYFLHDLLVVLTQYSTWGLANVLHVLVILPPLLYTTYTHCFAYYSACFVMWEASTPFVHVRWILHKSGRGGHWLYYVNGVVMILVFFLTRILWGGWVAYKFFVDTEAYLQHPRGEPLNAGVVWGFRVASVVGSCLSYFWFYRMVTKAAQLLTTDKKHA